MIPLTSILYPQRGKAKRSFQAVIRRLSLPKGEGRVRVSVL
jgi:hypothetical protein